MIKKEREKSEAEREIERVLKEVVREKETKLEAICISTVN